MTLKLLLGDDIRSQVLRILSGACFFKRRPEFRELYILSPWISDVEIELSELSSLKDDDWTIEWFTDYNIKSINLPYALLLLKLHEGIEVNIVTLPPNEMNYHEGLVRAKTLLDFLDEIGCNIFVNPKLHSKLLLANDLALLGSFNLSTSALYNREEIGVSIDDLDNLEKLWKYCMKVVQESERYGYSSLLKYGKRLEKSDHERYEYLIDLLAEAMESDRKSPSLESRARINEVTSQLNEIDSRMKYHSMNGITRGYALDKMIDCVFHAVSSTHERYGDFFDVIGGSDKLIKSYSHDLNVFYLLNLRKLIAYSNEWHDGKACVKQLIGYEGESVDSIMEYLNNKFVRKAIPNVKLRIKSLQ